MLITIPLNPFPNITAPMYFYGNIPEYAKAVAWTTPAKTPNTKRTAKHMQNPASGVLLSAMNGNIRTIIADTIKLETILIVYESLQR